jgi:outer membrane protein assembly factor BamB
MRCAASFPRPFASAVLVSTTVALLTATTLAGDWPRWRGPDGNGVTAETDLPQTWSATQNVTWKAPLPGPGNSSPVVLGDRVFVTCASEKGAVRSAICFGRADGKVRWRKDVSFKGEEPTHDTYPFDASTPTTDGQALYVWHGSAGFFAYDLDGNELWHRDLGPFIFIWGNASSPVLLGDRVILSAGPGPRSALLAMDKKTGKTIWQTELPDARPRKEDEWAGSWTTPVIRKTGDGKPELVLSLPDYVAGFDPETGKEIWRCRGLSRLCYADPLVGDGYIIAMCGYGGPAIGMREPKPGETGDLTDSHRLWVVPPNQQRIGSGQIVGGLVYMLNEPGVMQCIDPKTGKDLWKKRLTGTTWGSLIRSGELFYVTNSAGETIVFRATPKDLEVLHENPLGGEQTHATLSPSDGQVFVRTWKNLYCIGKRKAQ